MSGLVLNEKSIDPASIKTKTIKVERTNCINMGVRIWFQILTTEKEMYQRWAMNMNPTDEVMLLVNEGDSLDIQYIEDVAEDLVNCTFESFKRNIILNAKFTE